MMMKVVRQIEIQAETKLSFLLIWLSSSHIAASGVVGLA